MVRAKNDENSKKRCFTGTEGAMQGADYLTAE